MVESQQQIAVALAKGEYKEDDLVNVADSTYRICAPSDSNKKCSYVILWTKSGKDDKPDWSKVVSSFCHFNNLQYINNFSDRWICL